MNNKNFDFYIFDMSVGNRKPHPLKSLGRTGWISITQYGQPL